MAKPPLDPKLQNRITRYLHTGMEVPKYYPGCWDSHNYYTLDKLTAVDEALELDKNDIEVINIIVKAFKDGWYTRYETIIFALAKCLLKGGPAVKEAGYKAVADVCLTSEQIMLFVKYSRIFKSGTGQGWCKSIKQWYSKRDPLTLAKEITRVRGRYGHSHKTLIRKSHLKVEETDFARDAVVKYEIFGLKRAKQLFGSKEEAKAVLEYIQSVEDLRHCEDAVAAAAIVTRHHFNLNHVPSHLLTSQEVWDAILPQFSIEEVLQHLQRIHNMGFLTAESTTTAVILSMLNNKQLLKESRVTPIAIHIAICNYKMKTRPLKHEKAKVAMEKEQRRRTRQVFDSATGQWNWTTAKRHPKENKFWGMDLPPNLAILSALDKLLEQTWTLTEPTGARYLITLDMRHHMFKGRHFCKTYVIPKKSKVKATAAAPPKPAATSAGDTEPADKVKSKKHLLAECFYNKHVTPGHAAIILALQLLKREKNVKIAVFTEEGVNVIPIENKNFINVKEAEFLLRNAVLGRVQVDAPMKWAMNHNTNFDVFINMIDRSSRYSELDAPARGGRGEGGRFGPPPAAESELTDRCPVRALYAYRQMKKLPNAKLITLSLASHRVSTTDGSHEGVLDVIGIDEHVPKVMDAFVKGQFK